MIYEGLPIKKKQKRLEHIRFGSQTSIHTQYVDFYFIKKNVNFYMRERGI